MSQVQAVRPKSLSSDRLISGDIEGKTIVKADNAMMPTAVFTNVNRQWQQCITEIQKEVPHQTIQTWFHQITPVFYSENRLFLRVPSHFFSEWIDTHYGDILKKAVVQEFGDGTKVDYLIAMEKEEPVEQPAVVEPAAEIPPVLEAVKDPSKPKVFHQCAELDPHFRFENFFISVENEFAYNAAQVVAKELTKTGYNPLILYGETGSGKSHLVNALGNLVQKERPELKIVFYTSERFLHEYVRAAQNRKIHEFSRSLISADVFILEDIQYLKGKEKSQEELLYILLELIKRQAQVVLTANAAPCQLQQFNKRLLALLQKGLFADVPAAGCQAREQIIRHFLSKNEVQLEEKIIQFLTENLNQNIHNLHSVMVRIVAQISLTKRALSLREVKFIVSQICPDCYEGDDISPLRKEIGIDEIVNAAATYFNVPCDIIQGVSRKQKISMARHVAIYLCRELTSESLNCIGYHFSNLHHATVLYSCKKIKNDIEKNPKIRTSVQKIKALL